MGMITEMVDELAEHFDSELSEAFTLVEQAVESGEISMEEGLNAEQAALQALRLYTQISAGPDTILPHWMTEDGAMLALTVAKFTAYGYVLGQMSTEVDSIEKLIGDVRSILTESEEE